MVGNIMSVLNVKERPADANPKSLRRSGQVPMALVRKGGETVLLQATVNDVKRALAKAHGAGMIDVLIDGQKKPVGAIVKSVDRDTISRTLTHVSMLQVNQDDTIRVDVPVVAVGTPAAVAAGEAVLMHTSEHVKLKGKVSDIPDTIEVDISGLGVHESITAGHITLPEGVELLSAADSQIFSVALPPKYEETTETEGEESVEVPTVSETETPAEEA
jgi:large subunit ribosomal protein L25